MTKKEKDKLVHNRFQTLRGEGYTISQATRVVKKEFNILSDMTVFNIRKRCATGVSVSD